MKKILFLGYSEKRTSLINSLKNLDNISLERTSRKINKEYSKRFDFIISFGYRHKISKDIIQNVKRPIVNLHMGYLPFNKGAHPNFWSFIDNTTSGVTIHEIDSNIDTGNIIFQRQCDFNLTNNIKKLTFRNTYDHLFNEIEKLFDENINNIVNYNYKTYKQYGKGSFHKRDELPQILKQWDQNIYKTILRYNKQYKKYVKNKLDIINEIENTRKSNNVNWMNIIRTSFKNSPNETLKILKSINEDDNKISKLFSELNK
ncbi:formyltransferase family protein [Pelagibacteraceae bacterium]|nr:formyltransferase family protein [Pelagibacteraceae bacterium]